MSIVITAGQCGDSPQFEQVLNKIRVARTGSGRPRTRPSRVRADKAYASRRNRAYLRKRGIRCTIPEKADQHATAGIVAREVAVRRSSTRSTTGLATRSGAASIALNVTGPWPRDTTSWRSAMRQPCWSRPSMSGC